MKPENNVRFYSYKSTPMTLLQTISHIGFLTDTIVQFRLAEKLTATRSQLAEAEALLKGMTWYALAVTLLVFYLWGKYTALKAARHEPGTVNINHVTRLGSAKPGGFQEEFDRSLNAQGATQWTP
jgi:hypothetical protein